MERIDGGSRGSPHCSVPSGEAYTGSDLDHVSRDIGDEFSAALCDFELEREGLEDFDSELEEDGVAHDSDDVPSSAGSERIHGSDCEDLDGMDSDDAVPEPDVLEKLTRLATQFSQTVEKLRKKVLVRAKHQCDRFHYQNRIELLVSRRHLTPMR
jgi:hypothetical protein